MKNIWSKLELLSMAELRSGSVTELLETQLRYVSEKSAFYRKKYGSRNISNINDLEHLPFTTKRELLDDELNKPPFGTFLATPIKKISRAHRTSGTSANPLFLALSKKDISNTIECGARCFWASGLRPQDLVVHCLNYCMWAGGATDQHSLENTGAAVIPFGVGNSPILIQVILKMKPTAIHCTPSYLSKLELLLKNEFQMEPAQLGLRLGLFGGEAGIQNAEFRKSIELKWGFKAMDANYGLADVLSMFGAECEVRNGLHFMGQGVIHAELKDLKSDAIVPWEKGVVGELVLTHLRKECQPLLRYRTGDILEIIDVDKCECGRRSPRMKVIGRADDMIVVRGINVFLSSIAGIVNKHLDVFTGEYSVLVNEKDPIEDIEIKIEIQNGKDFSSIKDSVDRSFSENLSIRPILKPVPEGELPRTEDKTKRLERVLQTGG